MATAATTPITIPAMSPSVIVDPPFTEPDMTRVTVTTLPPDADVNTTTDPVVVMLVSDEVAVEPVDSAVAVDSVLEYVVLLLELVVCGTSVAKASAVVRLVPGFKA
jgi:hypothetical protein